MLSSPILRLICWLTIDSTEWNPSLPAELNKNLRQKHHYISCQSVLIHLQKFNAIAKILIPRGIKIKGCKGYPLIFENRVQIRNKAIKSIWNFNRLRSWIAICISFTRMQREWHTQFSFRRLFEQFCIEQFYHLSILVLQTIDHSLTDCRSRYAFQAEELTFFGIAHHRTVQLFPLLAFIATSKVVCYCGQIAQEHNDI